MNGKDDDRMKKYELTNEIKNLPGGVVLYRIRALRDFADVKAGDLGGFVQSESNLTQDGDAWVYHDAEAFGDAIVGGGAGVSNNAKVYGNAIVCGRARVNDNVEVFGQAGVCDDAMACDNAKVFGSAVVGGFAEVSDNAVVRDAATVTDRAKIKNCSIIGGRAMIGGEAIIYDNAEINDDSEWSLVTGFGRVGRTTTFFRCKDGKVRVQCGCFYGHLADFRAKVKETHGDSKMAREYLMIADLMELRFKKE